MQALELADGAPNNQWLAKLQLKVTKTALPPVSSDPPDSFTITHNVRLRMVLELHVLLELQMLIQLQIVLELQLLLQLQMA